MHIKAIVERWMQVNEAYAARGGKKINSSEIIVNKG